MTTTSTKAAQRGPAMDLLTQIADLLKVDLTNMEEDARFELEDRVFALLQAADLEKVLDAATPPEGGEPPPAPTPPAVQMSDPEHGRAVEGLEGDSLDMWVNDTLGVLRDVFGQPEADPAAVLELLRASADAFKGAVGTAEPPDDAGEGGQPVTETGERAALIGLRTENTQLKERLDALEAKDQRREIEDHIDAAYRSAGLRPPQDGPEEADKDRAELVELCLEVDDYKKLVARSLKNVNRPPQGTVTDPSQTAGGVRTGAEPTSKEAVIDKAKKEILQEQPDIGMRALRKQAYQKAKADNPDVFNANVPGHELP